MPNVVKANQGKKAVKIGLSKRFISSQVRVSRVVRVDRDNKVTKISLSRKSVSNKIRGVDVDTSRFIFHETPSPVANGAQLVFTVDDAYMPGLLEVFKDGLLQIKDVDYTETGLFTFTFVVAPEYDENLRVNYIKR